LILLHLKFEPERKIQHEEDHHHYRRLEWVWRFDCTRFGKRPFRVHVDPTQDGAEVVNMVSDRVRAELLRRIGLGALLTPRDSAVELQSAA
jgi:hypothetical protein